MKQKLLIVLLVIAGVAAVFVALTLRGTGNKQSIGTFFSGFTRPSIDIESDRVSSDASLPIFDKKSFMQYPSLDGSLIFLLTDIRQKPDSEESICTFEIRDKKNKLVDLSLFYSVDEIRCAEGETITSDFLGWAKGNQLLLATSTPGIIDIVDVSGKTKKEFSYDGLLYDFSGVTSDLSRFLLKKQEIIDDKTHYVVVSETQEILKEFDIAGNDRGALYDAVNDGFLFISRDFGDTQTDGYTPVSVRFDWLPVGTLELRHILTTDRARAPGHGCTGEEIASENAGEIIITQGCLIVNKKYLGKDNNIHISL